MGLWDQSRLVLYENNGWIFNGNFPNNVAEEIGPFMKSNTVAKVLRDPNAQDYAWLVPGLITSGSLTATLDPGLLSNLNSLVADGHVIKDVIIGPDRSSDWLIICTDSAYFANNHPSDAYQQLGNLVKAGFQLKTFVYNPSDAGGWLIICENNGWVVNGRFPSSATAVAPLNSSHRRACEADETWAAAQTEIKGGDNGNAQKNVRTQRKMNFIFI
jgi:hypothetical protein